MFVGIRNAGARHNRMWRTFCLPAALRCRSRIEKALVKTRFTFVFMVLSLLAFGATFGLAASAGPDNVCSGSKVDFENLPATVDGVTISVVDEKTVHFDIPDGATVEVCVKAGSAKQGNGPEYSVLTADADVFHASGKDLSHLSVVSLTSPTPDPTPSPTDPPPLPS